MTSRKTSKRYRQEGGSYHDTVPFSNDYQAVHAREGQLRRVGNSHITAPAERLRFNTSWNHATSWEPIDDPEFLLDPDGEWYDEAVEADVVTTDAVQEDVARPRKKYKQSRVSKRPHVVWKELHRQSYLDEILCWAGRGDFRSATQCPDCIARKIPVPGIPTYRCQDCFVPDLVCDLCCIKRHRTSPFHLISAWNGEFFSPTSLKAIGLTIQLNHASFFCPNPISSHPSLLVLHTNGIHEVAIKFCGCDRAIPQHLQLIRRGLYPASQITVKNCATFTLLDLLHKFALTTKAGTYDFYRGLEKLTVNTGICVPKTRYRALMRVVLQWRHLKMLKWGGRAHDTAGISATKPGKLAVQCPSCPRRNVNIPPDFENVSEELKFLYMMFVCMDANFRLKNQLVSSYSQDPGLGIGWAYLLPREPYESYIVSRANDEDVSTCVGLQALAKASSKFSTGLRHTGVGGAFCGRSEMILPSGIGNLQKGERYANMDFIFGTSIKKSDIPLILISYDIACQWFVHLHARIENHWPDAIKVNSKTTLIPAIPKLHEPMHGTLNHQVFSLNFIPGVGASDLEMPERVWSAHNSLGNSTKTQGPGSRQDVLDDHFNFWNWLKYIGMGKTLMRKYKAAVAERNIQVEAHRGLTDSLLASECSAHLPKEWEDMCLAWEKDSFPKTALNPYQAEVKNISEAQVRKNLADADERMLREGAVMMHVASASAFVLMGLELEDIQRRVRCLARGLTPRSTLRQEGSLTEQQNILRNRIHAWEEILPIYIPGILQYRADLEAASGTPVPRPASIHLEDMLLWLPSLIPMPHRQRICAANLPELEERLRLAQCNDALDSIRHILKVKSRMVLFKNKNVRGQRDGTRSRAIIDRVHEQARLSAEKYRASRIALKALRGSGTWEETLRVLEDADIRSYQDPNALCERQGCRGILEDDQMDLEATENSQTPELSLLNEVRNHRDGTGETRRTLSWIWLTQSSEGIIHEASDEILRTEWAKSRARANRAKEEVLLLREEMRRVSEFLKWKSSWWEDRVASRKNVTKDLDEGLAAYAKAQSTLQKSLDAEFCAIWVGPLIDISTSFNVEGDGETDDEDDDVNISDHDNELGTITNTEEDAISDDESDY